MSGQPHILVVDDERRIHTMLSRYLADEGYRVSEVLGGVISAIVRAALSGVGARGSALRS